ncbi:DUF5004 domain-containing protein [Abyssalbus ytuae]|uniref:DUF5004 domain-containing protein n=1 Tax=Abyssalbus ytuae TaxID=2926907 RepID=A0A9E7D3G8_9FLAO|nr:DUF5004 domain-containing protein [Abyssalbus ytuae]UOB19298.1 DUF5004 domain-containing protein [Abyssalbus ytuae]
MKTKRLFPAFFLVIILLNSCSSDDNNCQQNFTGALSANEEILVGKWVLTSLVASDEVDLTDDDTDNPSTDIYAQFTDCEKDSYYTFDDERIMRYVTGSSDTSCPNQNNIASSWKLEGSKLEFVTTCVLFESTINILPSNTAFTFSNEVVIRDVDNQEIQTTIVSTYTKETE